MRERHLEGGDRAGLAELPAHAPVVMTLPRRRPSTWFANRAIRRFTSIGSGGPNSGAPVPAPQFRRPQFQGRKRAHTSRR